MESAKYEFIACLPKLLFTVFLSLMATSVYAQAQPAPAKEQFEPRVGQEGKDVVWVPSPQTVVNKMLDMAKVTPKDYVIDLGSGDGRTVITAAKRGAKALGHRIQSGHGRVVEAQCRQGRRQRQSHIS